jgi:hypothetical protein
MHRSGRPRIAISASVVAIGVIASACTGGGSTPHASPARPTSPTTHAATTAADQLSVIAAREPLTTESRSPVAHDNEVMALAPHAGRLFAATDQWEYAGPNPAGQVLVKDSATSAWRVFEQTESLRVEAIDSFPIPANVAGGAGHALLVTQAIINGRSEIQWLVDDGAAFAPRDSYVLASKAVSVRSFGAHEDGGVWSVYAGASPTGILRGVWSNKTHSLVFDPKPELVAAPPGSPGLKTQKVTGFAECAGALYVSINTKLYRRNDGTLPPGMPRWAIVYEAPPVGAFNSGLRGLSCVTRAGAPALLVSTEGSGDVARLDHLPRGDVNAGAPRLVPTREFAPMPAIAGMLATQGTTVPASGKGAISYVIAAYNNFETTSIDGAERHMFGFEWAYAGGCPATRSCGPVAFNAATFDTAACFAIRTDHAPKPTYALRCLGGPDFTPTGPATKPIRTGQAFVSIRTIKPSPFGDDALYFGGYDCNFSPADGTAWIGRAPVSAIRLNEFPREEGS